MTTRSGILAWEVPWTEEPGGLSPLGCERVDLTERPNNNKWITQLCKKVSVLLLLLQSDKLSTGEN